MKKQGVSGLQIGLVYIGTVVGAGFATGQEILQFFAVFGLPGVWGVLLSTLLFVAFGVIIMQIGLATAAPSHRAVLEWAGGRTFARGMDVLILLSLFFALTAMMAGTGALSRQQFGISPAVGSILMGVITVITVLRGFEGVIRAISAVVPFLLVAVLFVGVYALVVAVDAAEAPVVEAGSGRLMGNWLTAAVLYGSYNILMSTAVLGPLGAEAGDRRAILRGGAIGGIGLGAMTILIYFALLASADARGVDVPLMHLANGIHPLVGAVFSVVLVAEIYTTAVGALFGFRARLGLSRRGVMATAVVAFFASLFGFYNLVRYLYPVQGYGGIVLIVVLAVAKIWKGGKL